jgi:hypothetical protein
MGREFFAGVKPAATKAQFQRERHRGKPARTPLGEEMAEQRRSEAAKQLRFFIARLLSGGWILRIPADAGQG